MLILHKSICCDPSSEPLDKMISGVTTYGFDEKYELENVFMKHYAPNHMLAPKKGSSQKGVQLKP